MDFVCSSQSLPIVCYWFLQSHHKNFIARDSEVGVLLFSILFEENDQAPLVRIILRYTCMHIVSVGGENTVVLLLFRTQNETIYRAIPAAQIPRHLSEPEDYVKV